jgi:hypothetical protein
LGIADMAADNSNYFGMEAFVIAPHRFNGKTAGKFKQ